jgi:hypothetical protein
VWAWFGDNHGRMTFNEGMTLEVEKKIRAIASCRAYTMIPLQKFYLDSDA